MPKMAVVDRWSGEHVQQRIQADSRVGDILISKGFITRDQVEAAFSVHGKKRIGVQLLESGCISEDQLLFALAAKFSLSFVDLSNLSPSPEALQTLPRDIVEKLCIFPVGLRGRKVVVATSDPTDKSIADTLGFLTNLQVEIVIATAEQISRAIAKYYTEPHHSPKALINELVHEEPVLVKEEDVAVYIEPDSKVVSLVNRILIDAYNNNVSDIHFEPELGDGPLQVRYRVDGECQPCYEVPAAHKNAVIARLKIMSKLDIAERRKPQSGKIVLLYEKKRLEFRVEITPTVEGQEDAVLRLLSGAEPLSLHEMGFSPQNLWKFREILKKPYGIVLCAGPTGSGKTTTLHSALAVINSPDRKIWTAEDPVEILQKGLRQVQVNPKIGFGFAEAMRSFLRADPDVIMIGEMRDLETSKTAIAASLTGHLVFSTLHTNSAPETVGRLMEMGIDPFHFADSLLAILAQRLARKLCEECKIPYQPSREEYQKLVFHYGEQHFKEHGMPQYSSDLCLMRKNGCPRCAGTGYRGRIALHELLVGSAEVKMAIKSNLAVEELRKIAVHGGMTTLKMDGIQKVFQGVTELQQILKVCIL